MSESEHFDVRVHDQRLGALWAYAFLSMKLVAILDTLYEHEINVGLQTFYDGGCEVWIGDPFNGRKVTETFERGEFEKIAPWLAKNAEDHYPLLKQARYRAMGKAQSEGAPV